MTAQPIDLVPARLRRKWAAEGLYPDLDLYAQFRAHRNAKPDRDAVIDAAGVLSYAELDRLVRCVAAGLRDLGVREDDVVAVQLPNGREAVAAEFAVAALGAVALPFPVGRGAAEAGALLAGSRARAVITVTAHGATTPAADVLETADRLPDLRTVIAFGSGQPPGAVPWHRLAEADGSRFVPARPDPDRAARILVSSGSEAAPKMVAYSHNALAGGRGNFIGSLLADREPPRSLFLVPLGSAFGSNATPATMARHGGCLILLDRFTPAAALEAIARHRPTHVLAVPAMVRMMLEQLAARGRPAGSPAPTALLLGGSELDRRTAAEAEAAFGCPVVNVYGSADGVNCHSGLPPLPDQDGGPGVAIGRCDPRVTEIRIDPLPGESGEAGGGHAEAVVPGAGEIVARGPMTPMSYVGEPGLNERYRTPDGWVRTGDLGVLDTAGTLRLVGRLKQIVIRGGLNISLAAVEHAVAAHPGVRDSVCVGMPDPTLGERVAACVVLRPGCRLDLESLCSFLAGNGLERTAHPEHLLVVERMPLTPAGKPDRAALRARLQR